MFGWAKDHCSRKRMTKVLSQLTQERERERADLWSNDWGGGDNEGPDRYRGVDFPKVSIED